MAHILVESLSRADSRTLENFGGDKSASETHLHSDGAI